MEKYYVLERFALMKTSVISTLEGMAAKRKAIEKNKKNNQIERAREVYKELEGLWKKLSDNILSLKLLFCEAEMETCSAYADKLYEAVSKFNLLTPDYTKFIEAFKPLIASIPDNQTTDSGGIVRFMNNVRMGYYPTDTRACKVYKEQSCVPGGQANKRV